MPIHYGYPAYDDAWGVEKELFPNAAQYVLGGCVVSLSDKGHERKLICRECRSAKAKWLRQRRKDRK